MPRSCFVPLTRLETAMSSAFKLIIPGALALYLASACQPDLASLSAEYSATSATSGSAGTEQPNNGDGGTDSSSGGRANGGGGAPVTVAACDNLKKDSNESDVDCGGSSKCDRCAAKSSCTKNTDCDSSLFCKGNRCAEPTCTDGVKNQNETAIDCGGTCDPCDVGVPCSINEDCDGEYCHDSVCANHCASGAREADETDKDCGGPSCDACADKLHCSVATDCKSLICSNNVCVAPTCSDAVKNQDESDKDCGGVCAATKPCMPGQTCTTAGDCKSWICSAAGKCLDDIVVPANQVIDDFEAADATLHLPTLEGRVGNWYPFGDGSSTYTLNVFAIKRGTSVTGLHTTGKEFKTWGSGVGVDLKNPGSGASTKLPYDATTATTEPYKGITFWARAELAAPATSLPIQFVLPDVDTDGADGTSPAWKTCTTCDHHYFKALSIGATWQRYTVLFSDLTLEPSGVPAPTAFKPDKMISVQFRLAVGTNYDLYIDDVAFVK